MVYLKISVATRSFYNDPYCGDQCACWENEGRIILCMVDGLGHGEPAQVAAEAAIDYMYKHPESSLEELFAGCDRSIRHTRGVAMNVIFIANGVLKHAGIGNVRSVIYRDESINLVGNWGIVGGGYRTLTVQSFNIEKGDLILMWTDGISEHFSLREYDRSLLQDEGQLADAILDDHGKITDDATVMIYRYRD